MHMGKYLLNFKVQMAYFSTDAIYSASVPNVAMYPARRGSGLG